MLKLGAKVGLCAQRIYPFINHYLHIERFLAFYLFLKSGNLGKEASLIFIFLFKLLHEEAIEKLDLFLRLDLSF